MHAKTWYSWFGGGITHYFQNLTFLSCQKKYRNVLFHFWIRIEQKGSTPLHFQEVFLPFVYLENYTLNCTDRWMITEWVRIFFVARFFYGNYSFLHWIIDNKFLLCIKYLCRQGSVKTYTQFNYYEGVLLDPMLYLPTFE